MRLLTRPWLVLAIAVAVVALPAAASGALSAPKAPAANSTTFNDSVGEDAAAPDITTIVASNDDAATISFKINIPNRPQYAADIAIVMFLDSDANQATGDPESLGADYIIQLIQGELLLFKWDGSDFTLSPTQSSLSYRMGGRADDPGERLRSQQHAEAPLRRHRGVGDRLRLHHGRDRLHELQA